MVMAEQLTPHIGKNVIETLTLGMYDDPRFIYREYVQNAADQIDQAVEEEILSHRSDGIIKITIFKEGKQIIIEDNATGVAANSVRGFLSDVANSQKDHTKRKGFRGIGRLGGLGYCEKLIFETSYKGEGIKSVMTLDANLLRKLISDQKVKADAATVISMITKISELQEDMQKHYFKVTLENVKYSEPILLNEDDVHNYLSMVAPVEFAESFSFTTKIKDYFQHKGIVLDEYRVNLNGTPVYKKYSNTMVDAHGSVFANLLNVSFFEVRDKEGKLLALGWYGISDKVNHVLHKDNIVRGIRVRKNNITIGDEFTLVPLFKAERTNLRYIGEVHVLGKGFIPNARRDYFNETKTRDDFETALREMFSDFENILPYKASSLHNRFKDVLEYHLKEQEFDEVHDKIGSQVEELQRREKLDQLREKALEASREIAKIQYETIEHPQIKDLFNSIIGDYDYRVQTIDSDSDTREYPPLEFSKVSKEQAEVLNEVVVLLEQHYGYKEARPIIKKLQKKYN